MIGKTSQKVTQLKDVEAFEAFCKPEKNMGQVETFQNWRIRLYLCSMLRNAKYVQRAGLQH